MKKNLLAGLLITGMGAVAQTPRLTLFEEFTGETCPPCAATNPGLNTILSSPTNTALCVAIKWQVPIPSAPSATWSLYQTNKSDIDWRYTGSGYGYPSQWTSTTAVTSGINAAPTGLFDGQHQWLFGAASDHPAYVTNGVIAAAQTPTSAFSITMARAWDATFSAVNLTVNIQATANFTSVGALVFRTVMIEKEIHFASQPGTNGEKDFYDAAIAAFPTLQAGVTMTNTWINGQTQTFTLNCPLPAYARDKAQIAFVGFIQDDGNRKVAQAVRAGAQALSNDAKALSLSIPFTCSTTIVPQVLVKNNGTNVITAFNITPNMNGTNGTVYNWTGSLAVGASTTITLASMPIISGQNTFSYSIGNVSGTDNNLLNNTASTSFIGVVNYAGTPVAEGFAGTLFPPLYFSETPSTWERSTAAGGFGLSTQSAKLNLYNGVPANSVSEFNLPPMHAGAISPVLWFDVAYAQYDGTENDQLDVMISDDCGATWTNMYSKAGAALMTAPKSTPAFVPTASQWRKDTVSLAGYANKDILVKFVGTSDYGNNIYLDNINLKSCGLDQVMATTPNTTICKGESATITASGATTYSWSNSSTATGATQVVTPIQTTTYTITNVAGTNCFINSATIQLKVNDCTGITTLSAADFNVNVYPNPSNGETSIIINTINAGKAGVSVINTLGQVVYKKQTDLTAGTNTLQIDVKEFASGLYNVVIDTENGSTVKKLTVSK